MIKISGGPSDAPLSAVVIVAFDRTKGHVHGTYVHGSHGEPDKASVERSLARFLRDLTAQLGTSADIDVIQLPLAELKDGWIERVDPATRNAVIGKGCHVSAEITRP